MRRLCRRNLNKKTVIIEKLLSENTWSITSTAFAVRCLFCAHCCCSFLARNALDLLSIDTSVSTVYLRIVRRGYYILDISRVMYDAPEAGLSPMIARFYPEWKVDKSSIATFLEPSRYCKEGVFNVQQVPLLKLWIKVNV